MRTKLFLLFCLFVSAGTAAAQGPRMVRVLIEPEARAVRMKIDGPFEVWDQQHNSLIYRGSGLNATVTAYRAGILLGAIRCAADAVSVRVEGEGAIDLDDRLFRNAVTLTKREAQDRLMVINLVALEDYVKGILYHEVSHYWPMEALKAQAIVCRTYARYQVQQNVRKEYDLTDDTYSQVYGGLTSERFRTSKAVDETRDLALTYEDKVLPAYFHAVCGGHTEDAALEWGVGLPPLKGVPCGYCKDSPRYNWHEVLSLDEVGQKLRQAGLVSGKHIKDITVKSRDPSGRISKLAVVNSQKELVVNGKDFRAALGPEVIMSTNFIVQIAGNDAVFEGVGWGHGVGMCQWGAYFMARQGKSCEEILAYYYPGAVITTIKE